MAFPDQAPIGRAPAGALNYMEAHLQGVLSGNCGNGTLYKRPPDQRQTRLRYKKKAAAHGDCCLLL